MKPNILYFYVSLPTDADREAAKALGAKLRDATKHVDGDVIEVCDGVAGFPPEAYAQAFPRCGAEPAAVAVGRAYCLHLAGGKWQVTRADGTIDGEPVSRATAYRRVKELNGG